MAKEYLDKDGLAYFWTKIKSYIAQQGGGGLTIDDIYPVGSIYTSVNSTNPGTLFAGTTWVQIEDTFLLAAGTNHAAGSTGGSEDAIVPYHRHSVSITSGAGTSHSHGKGTLAVSGGATEDAITGGAHTHDVGYRSVYSGGSNYSALTTTGTATATASAAAKSNTHKHDLPAHSHTVSGSTANESAHTHSVSGNTGYAGTSGNEVGANMPPYLAVYVWKRTA